MSKTVLVKKNIINSACFVMGISEVLSVQCDWVWISFYFLKLTLFRPVFNGFNVSLLTFSTNTEHN